MIDFLFADQNMPFAVAIALMLVIGLFEGVAILLGMGLSELLDSFLPDVDWEADADIGSLGSDSALTKVLGWLKVGRVPALILLIILLTMFGLSGYAINYVALSLFGVLLPAMLAVPVAVLVALPLMRTSAEIIARILPRDQSTAVSLDSLIGRVATITIGVASQDLAAEAKVKDAFGTTHYVSVLPETGHGPFTTTDKLLLVRREGGRFFVITATETAVTPATE